MPSSALSYRAIALRYSPCDALASASLTACVLRGVTIRSQPDAKIRKKRKVTAAIPYGHLSEADIIASSLLMRRRALQIFSLAIFLSLLSKAIAAPSSYQLEMTDVDQHALSTGDGHLSLIVVARTNQL